MKAYYQRDGITIYHGDCFDVVPALAGVGAVVTDPPYSSGGQFRGDRARSIVEKYVQTTTAAYRPEFGGDSRDQRSYLAWSTLWLHAARRAARPGALVACFIDWRQLPVMTDAIQAAGWLWRGTAVWSKRFGRPRNGGYSSACEFLPWGSHGALPATKRFAYGVCECSTPPSKLRQHVAQKPVDVMTWALSAVPDGALVLDPFLGSGSTLVAAAVRGLSAIGVDADERYCEIAARRLEQREEAAA